MPEYVGLSKADREAAQLADSVRRGKRIAQMRAEGLTPREICSLLGISYRQLKHYEMRVREAGHAP